MFVDMNIYVERMYALLNELGVKAIAPTHGLPILDLETTVPLAMEGLLSGRDLVFSDKATTSFNHKEAVA